MKFTLRISRILAVIGSVLTIVQFFFLLWGNDGICLNDSCKIVDSYTTISPLLFNVAGFLFFQLIFWGARFVREPSGWRFQLLRLFLLGALAAEAVLFCFQVLVIGMLCSYCLMILVLVVLLNILAGWRQVIAGAAVVAAIGIAFTSLQFAGAGGNLVQKLDEGTYAVLRGNSEQQKQYLFFSATCPHCEEVIASLGQKPGAVSFNPVDRVDSFPLDRAEKNIQYTPAINARLLKSLGIEQVPTLLIVKRSEYRILTGAVAIEEYFVSPASADGMSGASSMSMQSPVPPGVSGQSQSYLQVPGTTDTCTVGQECE